MKKTILILTLCCSFSFGQTLNHSHEVETQITEAMNYYKNKEYSKAVQEFEKIKNYTDIAKIDFYIGRSYYEIGEYEKALVAYERVSINEPDNQRVLLEIAQTYFVMGMYQQSKEEFEKVLSTNNLPQNVKNNINRQLSIIKRQSNKHLFNTALLVGVGYDSNIDNSSSINSYNLWVPQLDSNLSITPSEKRSSTIYESALMLNHLYKYDNNFSIRSGVTLYTNDYTKDSDKNISLVSIHTTPSYSFDRQSYSLGLSYEYITLDDTKYLENYIITPKFSYLIDNDMFYELYLRYIKKTFHKNYNDRDADVYNLSNKISFKTTKYGLFSLENILGMEDRKKDTRTDISKKYISLKGQNSYQLFNKTYLNTSLAYTYTKYKHYDVNFKNRRDNDTYIFNLGMSYIFTPQISLNGNYGYTKQISNQEAFTYNKHTFKTNILYNF